MPLPHPPCVPHNTMELCKLLCRETEAVIVLKVPGIKPHHNTLPAEEVQSRVLVEVEGMGLDEISSKDQLECCRCLF